MSSRASTMLAAILCDLRQPLVLDEVQLPRELGVGQVLVRVLYSSICGAQLGEIDGVKGPDRFLPHLLGHEGSGVVKEVGPGVQNVREGDHVVLHWMKGQGIESEPPAYTWRGNRLNGGWVTTFNEYAVVSENRVTRVPPGLDLDVAPLFGCAVTTALGVLSNNAHLRPGESVVVIGAGGVGLNVVQGAALMAGQPVIAVDIVDAKLQAARQFGATHCINASATSADVGEAIRESLEDEGADVVVETTGLVSNIELAYRIANPQGRVVCVGVPKKGEHISIYSLPLHFGKVLTGSHGGETNPTRDIRRYARLYQAGKLKLRELVTKRVPLTDINAAIDGVRNGEVTGRCLIEMGSVARFQ